MIKLSKRLDAIASFIREDAKIVDIGCDHALLDIYLTEKYKNLTSIAVDVREGAIKQATKNIEQYNAEGIDLRLGDGLNVVNQNEIDTIIISGLGSSTILDIISKSKDKLLNVEDIIIQTNTEPYILRRYLVKLGFYIAGEKLVGENNIIYPIIHFTLGNVKYKEEDYLFGPILRLEKSELYIKMIGEELKKKEILYSLIPPKYVFKRYRLKKLINRLKKEIK